MPQLLPANYPNKAVPSSADILPLVDVASANEVKTATFGSLPISIATQTALDLKLNLSGGTLTGDIANTSTGHFQVASGTTAQRPASSQNGMIRYNTTTLRNEFFGNGAWRNHARLEGDTFTGTITAPQIASPVQTFTPAGTTQTINLALGSIIIINLGSATGNVTLTIQNATAGATYLITVIQGGTARNLIFPVGTRQNGARGNTYTGVANTRDKIAMDFSDGTALDISVNTNFTS